jgi:hypothetical protein
MKIIKYITFEGLAAAATFARAFTLVSALTFGIGPIRADQPLDHPVKARMTINAGTVFNLSPVFDPSGNPVFPWSHEVRGVVQISNLGNAIASFAVQINAGSDCAGGRAFCLSGTMKITTLAGDELNTEVVGWADPDPNDLQASPSMYLFHYDVTVTGGTGKLQGATGQGEINGAFNFCGGDCFCESYAGVATWLYEGGLHLPRK